MGQKRTNPREGTETLVCTAMLPRCSCDSLQRQKRTNPRKGIETELPPHGDGPNLFVTSSEEYEPP